MLCNAQSLGNKLQELHHLLYCERFDVVLITESWLDDSFTHGLLDPKLKYNVFRKDRNRHGGGVCIFVSNHLKTVKVDLDDKYNHLEILCIDIVTKPLSLRVFVTYRPPGVDIAAVMYLASLIECIHTYCLLNRVNVVTGDLNSPKISWTDFTCPNDNIHKPLLDCVIECGFSQIVEFPTRQTHILDIILIDEVQRVLTVSEGPPIGYSDHCCVEFSLLVDVTEDTTVRNSSYYLWCRADFPSINEYLAYIDWYNLICNFPAAIDMWTAFMNVVYHAINLYVPIKSSKVHYAHHRKCNSPDYPKEIRKAFAMKLRCWRNYKTNSRSHLHKTQYYKRVQICKELVHRYEMDCELRILEANNIGAFYRFVNKRLRNKTGISPLHNSSGDLITDDASKADLLNNYFASVGTIDNGVLPTSTTTTTVSTRHGTHKLEQIIFTETYVAAAIHKLKSNLSSGPDGLPPLFYKCTAGCLAQPLAALFTQMMSVSVVPEDWKVAIIVPVFKKGTATNVENYRPISLTCVASKIMERIISDQMASFFLENNVINKAQHGFLKGLSTSTNLLECFNHWTISIQARKSVTVAYIDFAKAFDTVSHPKLLYRLKQYGIDGCLLKWIESFLSGRSHATRVGHCLSSILDLSSGTIQGSGIGPLLFITYINELADLLSDYNVIVKLFADDLKLYAEISTDIETTHFNGALQCINDWANAWQLQISIAKCCVLQLNKKCLENLPGPFFINGTPLPICNSVKDLGVVVNESLSPSSHIAKITVTAYQRVNLIFRCFVSRDNQILLRAYTTYVRPLLEYCTVVWSPSLKCDIHSIEKVQKKFTKRLSGCNSLTYTERRNKLNLTTLELRRLYYDLVMCYKIVFNIVQLDFSEFFARNTYPSTRGHPYKLYVNHNRANIRYHFFACRVVKMWNSLPVDIIDFSSLSRFRRSLCKIDFSEFLTVQ